MLIFYITLGGNMLLSFVKIIKTNRRSRHAELVSASIQGDGINYNPKKKPAPQ